MFKNESEFLDFANAAFTELGIDQSELIDSWNYSFFYLTVFGVFPSDTEIEITFFSEGPSEKPITKEVALKRCLTKYTMINGPFLDASAIDTSDVKNARSTSSSTLSSVKTLFNSLDADLKGYISFDDIVNCLTILRKDEQLSDLEKEIQYLKNIFTILDTRGTGRLLIDDFQRIF